MEVKAAKAEEGRYNPELAVVVNRVIPPAAFVCIWKEHDAPLS